MSDLLGIPVHVNPHVPDGTVLMFGREVVVIGTLPRTELELARWQARYLVQQGLVDVLEWLGEKPIPEHPPTGAGIIAKLKRDHVDRLAAETFAATYAAMRRSTR